MYTWYINKHSGNTEFCFVPLRSRGNKTHSSLWGQSLSVMLSLSTQKYEKKLRKKIICLTSAGTQISRGFKVYDLITCESKVRSWPTTRETFSFNRKTYLAGILSSAISLAAGFKISQLWVIIIVPFSVVNNLLTHDELFRVTSVSSLLTLVSLSKS